MVAEKRLKHIEELLEVLVETTELPEAMTVKQCMKYLDVTSPKTVSNYVCNGTIPRDAVVTLVNGVRRFLKSKLVKYTAPAHIQTQKPNSLQLSLF